MYIQLFDFRLTITAHLSTQPTGVEICPHILPNAFLPKGRPDGGEV